MHKRVGNARLMCVCACTYLYVCVYVCTCVHMFVHIRPAPIMHFKLPIMLLSDAPFFSLLYPDYAQLHPIMLHFSLEHCYLNPLQIS